MTCLGAEALRREELAGEVVVDNGVGTKCRDTGGSAIRLVPTLETEPLLFNPLTFCHGELSAASGNRMSLGFLLCFLYDFIAFKLIRKVDI